MPRYVEGKEVSGVAPWGHFPKKTACAGNNNGYGPHEHDGKSGCITLLNEPHFQLATFLCRHCGAVFAKVWEFPR